MAKTIDADVVIEKWERWLKHLTAYASQMALDDELYWQLAGVFAADNAWKQLPRDVPRLIEVGYLTSTLLSLRAFLDTDRRTVSLFHLLTDMDKHHRILTVDRYVARYDSTTRFIARSDFAAVVGDPDATHVPKGFFAARLKRLTVRLKKCEDHTNTILTHWNPSAGVPTPTYDEMRECVVAVLDEMTVVRHVLLAEELAAPQRMYQWYESIRRPWLGPDAHPPPYVTLGEIRRRMAHRDAAG